MCISIYSLQLWVLPTQKKRMAHLTHAQKQMIAQLIVKKHTITSITEAVGKNELGASLPIKCIQNIDYQKI